MSIVQPATRLAILLACACAIGGCLLGPSRYDQATYGYVMRLGSAERITAWTLAQRDEGRIRDGLLALSRYASWRWEENPAGAERAAAGFVRAYEKLRAGWPGFEVSPYIPLIDEHPDLSGDPAAQHLEETIGVAYIVAASNMGEETWRAIRPPQTEPRRLDEWKRAARYQGYRTE